MSRILLDTQILLWALAGDRRLPKEARKVIEASDVFVSAASIWEVAIKVAIGKLKADAAAVRDALEPSGFEELPVTGAHAAHVASLPFHHRDPFDRLLVAQSELEPMMLVTADAQLGVYGGFVRVLGR